MGVSIDEFCERYPLLYHMAWEGSWPTIERFGLMSTSALLDIWGVTGEERDAVEATHRPQSVRISRPNLPPVVIRDQHPMSESALRRALIGGISPQDWYRILNARVFFWLTEDRLSRMLSAPPYAHLPHTVFTLNTRSVAQDYWPKVWLAPMNTGCTVPYAHPRGVDTFKRPYDYPWDQRRRLGDNAVVEFTVEEGVRDIHKYLMNVEHRDAARTWAKNRKGSAQTEMKFGWPS